MPDQEVLLWTTIMTLIFYGVRQDLGVYLSYAVIASQSSTPLEWAQNTIAFILLLGLGGVARSVWD